MFFKGDVSLLKSRCLAIVGTRKSSRYGRETARKIASELCQYGFTIVSGFAEGIDTEAHYGALEAKGRTIAVFGCGLDTIFPASNLRLGKQIEQNGCIISELPPGHPTAKWTFPRRNRIIAGLSVGVVMVQGHYDSGAMITAKCAIDEGREVFAVPGEISMEQSKGPHWLIKQGAKLIENTGDIIEEFGIKYNGTRESQKDLSLLSSDETMLIYSMSREALHIDEISLKLGREITNILAMLSVLEMKGYVKQLPGKYFILS